MPGESDRHARREAERGPAFPRDDEAQGALPLQRRRVPPRRRSACTSVAISRLSRAAWALSRVSASSRALSAASCRPIVEAFHKAVVEAVKDPKVVEILQRTDQEALGSSQAEARRILADTSRQWGEVARRIGLSLD